MKLYIKEKVFSWGDHFYVRDAAGREKYEVRGEVFSLGKKLHIYDMEGREVALIMQRLLTFLPKYEVYVREEKVAEVKQVFSFLRPRFVAEGLNWEVEGRIMWHDYEITRNGSPVVTIRKEWMTWGDSYELDIANPTDEIFALAVVLTIDCVAEAQD